MKQAKINTMTVIAFLKDMNYPETKPSKCYKTIISIAKKIKKSSGQERLQNLAQAVKIADMSQAKAKQILLRFTVHFTGQRYKTMLPPHSGYG